ncbi:MAG: hypothetical protein C0392_03490 [Syntrophus sp. (in: bacteria)]|nr:hypothetical protein [Syntrophus sp. (in: bacteria)]
MWKIIYNLLLHLLIPFFVLFSLTRQKIRKTLRERFFPSPLKGSADDVFWIHAASIGEAVIAENVVSYMKGLKGVNRFLITTNTYYTRDLLRRKFGDRMPVYSLPFDIPFSIKRFAGKSKFKALLIIETEIWPNLIWFAKKKGIPVIIINGRISDSTLKRYMQFAFFMKHVFSGVDLVLAQSEEHRERFALIGMDPRRIINTGNLKYYRPMQEGEEDEPKGKIVTFGSIKEKEVPIIIPVIKRLKQVFSDYLFFIAPRELHLISFLEEQFIEYFDVMRYSVYKGLPDAKPAIIIVDTVGDLINIYKKSTIAFVGGSLAPYGGQNMLEPLFFGTPVIFGPYVDTFKGIAEEVVQSGAGIQVATGEELFDRMRGIILDETLRQHMGREGIGVVVKQRRAMEQTVNAVMEATWKNFQNS